MANKSIFDAFERMWQHTVAKLGLKADKDEIQETYETKAAAGDKLAQAKSYADEAAAAVKNDLLNGAGAAYDTLKELGDLIDENQDALEALETVATGKADAEHTHSWNELEDKPFYYEVSETVLIDDTYEGNIGWIDEGNYYACYLMNIDLKLKNAFIAGETYTVTVNSTLFDDVVACEDLDCAILGAEKYNDNSFTNYPFKFLMPLNASTVAELYFSKELYNENGENTFSIMKVDREIKQIDDMCIPDTIARVSNLATVATTGSWNDLTDKPFYEEYSESGDTLTWDGNTDGRVCVMDAFYHVSDAIPTLDDFVNGCYGVMMYDGVGEEYIVEYEDLAGAFNEFGFIGGDAFFIIPNDDFVIEEAGWTFPKAGIYFVASDGIYLNTLTIPNYGKFSGVQLKTIDDKFISGTFARRAYIDEEFDFAHRKIDDIISGTTTVPMARLAENAYNAGSADYAQYAKHAESDGAGQKLATEEYVDNAVSNIDVETSTPDWNQNDETAADYIKNRPFFTGEPIETEIFPKQQLTFTNATTFFMGTSPVQIDLEIGKTYKVYYGDQEYECVCVDFNGYGIIGNSTLVGIEGNNNGEPFVYGGMALNYFWATQEEVEIGLSIVDNEIIKIPEKYLPIAEEDVYGIVKRSEIVTPYHFTSVLVSADEMNKAVSEFESGKAKIRWNINEVINAKRLSDDTIVLQFNDGYTEKYTRTESGIYSRSLGETVEAQVMVSQDTVASVGQTIVVRNVNDDGYPIEWEVKSLTATDDGEGNVTLAFN